MAPSSRRLADQRRIRIATMLMASGSIAGTGVFEVLAATTTHAKQSTGTTTTSSNSTQSDLAAPTSTPTQAYAPPVAQSGGS